MVTRTGARITKETIMAHVRDNLPSHMNITGDIFEHQLESAVKRFEAEGFKLQSWSRIPYLCEGDLAQPLYHLNNALIVMKKA